MRLLLVALATVLTVALARRDPTKWNRNEVPRQLARQALNSSPPDYGNSSSSRTPIIEQTEAVKKFIVNGTSIPEVDFDIGESYAGLMPIGPEQDVSELYFWFFPSLNPDAGDEILIWLNGGPGCSSLEGLLQENGPFLWQFGTFKPVKNPWTWVNLTNVVWVEQPAGTGFSTQGGTPPARDQIEVAKQFLGFWKNFVDTFGLQDRKVFITGESYAGYYVPYIADAMHNETNREYYNVEGIMIYDPVLTDNVVHGDIPAVPFVDQWSGLFNLNESFMEDLYERHEACGYQKFIEEAYVFPPKGPLPTAPHLDQRNVSCRLAADVVSAVLLVNPCWDIYHVATTCPLLWDVLGFPGTLDYIPQGADIYFDREDVKKAINAPDREWSECVDNVLRPDNSVPSAQSVLPRVIEKNKRTIVAHAELDFVVLKNGSIIAMQNMTWNGAQGFSKAPEEWNKFFVPYHPRTSLSTLAGAGYYGSWYTERGLTFATIDLSGHMVPQYAPAAAYRHVEFLLGRIPDLGEISDFTTQKEDWGNDNATMRHRSPAKENNKTSSLGSSRGDGFDIPSHRPAPKASQFHAKSTPKNRGDGFDGSTIKAKPASSQFAPTPRFNSGRPAPPSRLASNELSAEQDFAQALRSPAKVADEVVDTSSQGQADDDEMLDHEEEAAVPSTEGGHEQRQWTQDLPHSPKRRRIDDLSASFQAALDTPARSTMFKHPTTPASALRAGPQQFSRASSLASSSADDSTAARRPAFLRSSLAPPENFEPVPEAFSPHRRGEKFVPGGMAATLQQWVIEAGQAAAHSRRGQGYLQGENYVHRVKVASVAGHGPILVEGRHQDESEARVLLIMDGKRASRNMFPDSIVGIRAPCWEVELEGRNWIVGVDWKALA
ncbi:hypothetical protein CKM354_000599100 [Cercospora kikuchii]|uniref:Carboxypeptidase n=1 Tax=Cercospora kikuchii TaxID=84275 RepID=A0A9P3CGD2_9PEZI|nr:uncharacterized protein CKM354_000599100 [Cercospora kikuchii]GIZ42732.1 hypothetical protein CKM354_000599100 [Cercospora kikuchii]